MDHVLGLLESAFLKSEREEDKALVKRLFYGTTRQTLVLPGTPREGREVEASTTKDEEFSSLIVDVHPDLYAALDSSFQGSFVEYEGKQALRTLSISTLPPILTITLKRVQYSVEAQTSFKNNAYMKFQERIFVDRFCIENEESVNEKRKESATLISELESLQSQIQKTDTQILQDALDGLQVLEEDTPIFYESVFFLTEAIEKSREEATRISEAISERQSRLDGLYESFQSKPYVLHAVLFHQGEAQYGHYWIYLKDH
ncbi:ubiquitin-specific protease ubp2, partial [Dinochytrium kinnereticum]